MPPSSMRVSICFAAMLCSPLAACGGNSNRPVDAGVPDSPPVDTAMPDTGPPPCGYTEKADSSNDPAADPDSNPAPEATGLTVGNTPQILCGTINSGHFNPDSMTVDADAYRVTTDGTDLIVRFSGAPAAAAFDFSVFVFDTEPNPALLFGSHNSSLVPDHGAFPIALPAGTYDVVVSVHSSADLTTPFDYRVEIAADRATRCPAVTAPAAYTEAADGDGTNNDVIAVDFDLDPAFQLTASGSDVPEATGLTIGVSPVRITGASANVDADDDYMDRDTYVVRTGPATTELTLRLNWGSSAVDLDYLVFPADRTDEVGGSLRFEGNEEYNTIAVNPDATYRIWIGSHDGSVGLPATYDLTICGGSAAR
jgi:hypothetical protein